MIQAEETYYELLQNSRNADTFGPGRPCAMKLCIDCRQTEPDNVADIRKGVRAQIWKDYLFVLFFALTASLVTFGVK